MNIKLKPEYKVYAAAIDDVLGFENAALIADDENAYIAKTTDGTYKCLFDGADGFGRYADKYGLDKAKEICVYNMPIDFPIKTGIHADACVTYAYFEPMPQAVDGVDIRRLAPTLAETVASRYSNKSGAYSVAEMQKLMRDKGVFGAIENGTLAGFIGRHADGSMGMLDVDERFRRRGLGENLQKFMMTYVMTYGRVPLCDVYVDNEASVKLQNKLGMTPAPAYTFWIIR